MGDLIFYKFFASFLFIVLTISVECSEYLKISKISIATNVQISESTLKDILTSEIVSSHDYELSIGEGNVPFSLSLIIDKNFTARIKIINKKDGSEKVSERKMKGKSQYLRQGLATFIRTTINPWNENKVTKADYPPVIYKKSVPKKIVKLKKEVVVEVSKVPVKEEIIVQNKKEESIQKVEKPSLQKTTGSNPIQIELPLKKKDKIIVKAEELKEDEKNLDDEVVAKTKGSSFFTLDGIKLFFSAGLDLTSLQFNEGVIGDGPPGALSFEFGVYFLNAGHQLSFKTSFYNQSTDKIKTYEKTTKEFFYRYRLFDFKIGKTNSEIVDNKAGGDINIFPTLGFKLISFSKLGFTEESNIPIIQLGVDTSIYSLFRLSLGYETAIADISPIYLNRLNDTSSSFYLGLSFGWGL